MLHFVFSCKTDICFSLKSNLLFHILADRQPPPYVTSRAATDYEQNRTSFQPPPPLPRAPYPTGYSPKTNLPE